MIMEELSIEEKAKAYDEAREKIAVRFGTNVAEEIFSEFEESEDERIRKGLINYFNHHKNGINIFYGIKGDDILAWLEKQGEYFLPVNSIKCNSAWSEEDEEKLNRIISIIHCYTGTVQEENELNSWLKSLKDRVQPKSQWKPSDEQLEALKNAIHIKPFENPSDNPLWGLYEQLKKLL